MYNVYNGYPLPYYPNTPLYSLSNIYRNFAYPYYFDQLMYNPNNYYMDNPPYYPNENTQGYNSESLDQLNEDYIPFVHDQRCYSRSDFMEIQTNVDVIDLVDYGSKPFVVNIDDATKQNINFRTALWTGNHLQVTLMSIEVGGEIGLEIHPDTDQFIRIEDGKGIVRIGSSEDNLDFERKISDDFAIIIPAGSWHNIINTGTKPLKVYSIYAPPHHPHGTIHKTKADSEASDEQSHSIKNNDTTNTIITRNYW